MNFLVVVTVLLVLAVIGVQVFVSKVLIKSLKPEVNQVYELRKRAQELHNRMHRNELLFMRADAAGRLRLEAVQDILRKEHVAVRKQIIEFEIEQAEREALNA